jgi:hypothetical protein
MQKGVVFVGSRDIFLSGVHFSNVHMATAGQDR